MPQGALLKTKKITWPKHFGSFENDNRNQMQYFFVYHLMWRSSFVLLLTCPYDVSYMLEDISTLKLQCTHDHLKKIRTNSDFWGFIGNKHYEIIVSLQFGAFCVIVPILELVSHSNACGWITPVLQLATVYHGVVLQCLNRVVGEQVCSSCNKKWWGQRSRPHRFTCCRESNHVETNLSHFKA